jgi:hypothetical protein
MTPRRETAPNLAEAIMLMTRELQQPSRRAKAKEPDTYDGSDPEKLNSFILLCNLYFRHNPSYSDDQTKVTFALSYLRGTALEYFEPSILDSSDISVWSHDWSAFTRTLRTHFGPIDPTADAEDDIDNLKMSENHHIVKYNVKFNRLAIQTGWDDSVLRHRYYSGLAERIKDIMGQQRKPPTLSAMRNLAHSIDSHYWDRLREKSRSETSVLHSETSVLHSENSVLHSENSASNSENSAPPPSSKHHPASSVPSAVSDKLGKDGKLTFQERQRRFDNNLCLCCGKAGHMVKECPKSLARARAAQAKEFSEAEDSDSENSVDSNNSEDSNNSDHDNADSGNYDSEDSESHGNSDPEDPNYDNLYSDNSDPEDSDSNNSGSDKTDSENPVSDNSDSEDSDPGNSGSEHSEPRDPASDNPESDDSGSEDSE